jgi:hypothetical protein
MGPTELKLLEEGSYHPEASLLEKGSPVGLDG